MASAAERTKGELVVDAEAKEKLLMAGGALWELQGCIQRPAEESGGQSDHKRLLTAAVARGNSHQRLSVPAQ